MFLLSLSSLSLSAIFGIDYGHEYIKVGMAVPGRPIYVAINQQSKRLSPSYFAIWNASDPNFQTKEHWSLDQLADLKWEFLDPAKTHSLRFPHNIVKGLSPIMSQSAGLTRREAFAIVLRHLIKTVDNSRWTPESSQLILTVEPFLPKPDRFALSEAAALANVTLGAIIDSPTAAAQVYALERQNSYTDKPKNVVFVDIGATAAWAAVFNFRLSEGKPIATELSIVTNISLGGELLDKVLSKLLSERFELQNKQKLPETARVRRRFLEEARRAKEVLTVGRSVEVRIEDIVDDTGLTYTISREEFEILIGDFGDSVKALYNTAVDEAKLARDQIDYVELIGGGTRVPVVQAALLEASGLEKLNRTMNSDEVLAVGAGYVGASLSSAFIVLKTEISVFANAAVTLHHNGTETQLFGYKSTLKETANYTIPVSASIDSFVLLANGVPVVTFSLSLPETVSDDEVVTIVFGFNELTLPAVKQVLCNDVSVTWKQVTTLPDWALSAKEAEESAAVIARIEEIMDARKRFDRALNDYESFIYGTEDRLEFDELLKKVANETVRAEIKDVVAEHRQWLAGEREASRLSEDVVTEKLNELKDALRAVERRADEFKKRGPAWVKLNASLTHVFFTINRSWPVTKPWLTEEQLQSVWNQYNRTKGWFDEKYELQRNTPDDQDPVVTASEIDTQVLLLEWSFNSTSKIRKPTPTPIPIPKPEINETEIEDGSQGELIVTDVNETEIEDGSQGELIVTEVNETEIEDGSQGELIVTDVNETEIDGLLWKTDGNPPEIEGEGEGGTASNGFDETRTATEGGSQSEQGNADENQTEKSNDDDGGKDGQTTTDQDAETESGKSGGDL